LPFLQSRVVSAQSRIAPLGGQGALALLWQ
jgi:hypothetical protein